MQQDTALLTMNEAAIHEKTTYDAIKKRVHRGTIRSTEIEGKKYIHPHDLSKKGQKNYYAKLKDDAAEQLTLDTYPLKPQNYKDMTILDLTEKQREEAYFWEKTVKDWQHYIFDYTKEKTEKTKEYIKMFNAIHSDRKLISDRTLRRKWELYRKYGIVALADDRRQGNHTGTTIPDRIYAVFMQWWLDENKPAVTLIRTLTEEWAKKNAPGLLPLPSVTAFYNATKQIPTPVLKYYRDGEKVFADDCLPYVKRIYENFDSNDIWSADYHTLDFFVEDDVTGEVFRPHLIIWIDVRSRKILSVYLTKSANSDGTVISFRKATENHGIPKMTYQDHGREFLVSDFGGRGNRKTDNNANYGKTILERLGVDMHMAIVKNAKAKVIERVFRDVTSELSKLIKTYCGGKPGQRPERLNRLIKKGKENPLLSQVREDLETYLFGWHNKRKSAAEGLKGKSPDECYYEHLTTKRIATKEELNLMLLRSTRMQKVKRNGVSIKIGDTDVWFYSDALVRDYMGHSVFVRYNPEDLKQVQIYDGKERIIGYAELTRSGGYDLNGRENVEAIKESLIFMVKHAKTSPIAICRPKSVQKAFQQRNEANIYRSGKFRAERPLLVFAYELQQLS